MAPTSTTAFAHSIPRLASASRLKLPFICHGPISCSSSSLVAARFLRNCVLQEPAQDMSTYREKFSQRMAMAGLKPHHRIALGVSGGPDSMALCVLAAAWKTAGPDSTTRTNGFIDGLLAIIVDHGLRLESGEEAKTVQQRVSDIGIKYFRDFAINNSSVSFLLHIMQMTRLSRNSGVLGLAGMALTSELFSKFMHSRIMDLNHGILVVRPLLDFTKEDLYEICRADRLDWVEDPTNRSPSYVRNRIRMSLQNFSSTSTFMSELQALISACRRTRIYVDKTCSDLISRSLTITDLGYAVIDLPVLNASKVDDISLAKFCSIVVQFISQRHRPVRGSTSKLLLNYIRTFPCKTSLTAAGCYLSPAPGSKGTKVLVCCSVNCPLPSKTELFCLEDSKEDHEDDFISNELQGIIDLANSYSDLYCPDASDVRFLDTSSSVLTEAKRLNMISESTYRSILSMQEEEMKRFKPKYDSDYERKSLVGSANSSEAKLLEPGQTGKFMNRFSISWRWHEEFAGNCCRSCLVGQNKVAVKVRHMEERDWLYLSQLSRDQSSENGLAKSCLDRAISAGHCLRFLKALPAAARKSLPVLVDSDGLLLSIPIIGFKHCPLLEVSCKWKPTVPLGGGHSSFI
ncbi:hypothetical protein CRG98_019325 [Punica granatum]|uniref:tRNA(Ile)-lysidine synthetase n=1 Tax=Punica granatum TaxID=22663 RepID=A0A2I0JWL5_PUNGR|nr:hypothetical protein CRG98_019325 [Punica granatum]